MKARVHPRRRHGPRGQGGFSRLPRRGGGDADGDGGGWRKDGVGAVVPRTASAMWWTSALIPSAPVGTGIRKYAARSATLPPGPSTRGGRRAREAPRAPSCAGSVSNVGPVVALLASSLCCRGRSPPRRTGGYPRSATIPNTVVPRRSRPRRQRSHTRRDHRIRHLHRRRSHHRRRRNGPMVEVAAASGPARIARVAQTGRGPARTARAAPTTRTAATGITPSTTTPATQVPGTERLVQFGLPPRGSPPSKRSRVAP